MERQKRKPGEWLESHRNLPPTTMANSACGVQTVDYAMNWHRMTVQLPPFKGGLGFTPQSALASLLSTLAQVLSLDGWRNAHT